jgi:hypothetical protein
MVEDLLVFEPGAGPVAWPGGLAAWEAHRSARPAARRPRPTPPAGRARPAGRSPSTLRHLLAETAGELVDLTARLDAVRTEVAAAATDHAALLRLTDEMDDLVEQTAAAEERWLAIATEAEESGIDPGPPPG